MEEKKTLDCINMCKAQSIITILNAFYSEYNNEAIVRSIKNACTDNIIDSLISELRNSYNIFYTPGMFIDGYGHVMRSNKLASVNSEDSENDTAKITASKSDFDQEDYEKVTKYAEDFDQEDYENFTAYVEEQRVQICSALDLPPDANFLCINDTICNLVYFKDCLMSVLKMLENEYSIKVCLGSDADTVAKFIDRELTQRCNLADEVFDNQCKRYDEQREKICDNLGIHPDSSFEHICDALEPLLYYRSLNNKFIELIAMLKREYNIDVNFAKSAEQMTKEVKDEIESIFDDTRKEADAQYEAMERSRKDIITELRLKRDSDWGAIADEVKKIYEYYRKYKAHIFGL
jgi:hypothetical protein